MPAFPSLPGEDTAVLADGRHVGDDWPWLDAADRASYDAAEAAFRALAATVDPDDPWSHPDADRLDRSSVGTWLRAQGATPQAVRARDVAMLSLAAESVERTSLLSDLRKEAAAGAPASTPTTSGSASGSPRARRPSRCGWPPSWGTASATARR